MSLNLSKSPFPHLSDGSDPSKVASANIDGVLTVPNALGCYLLFILRVVAGLSWAALAWGLSGSAHSGTVRAGVIRRPDWLLVLCLCLYGVSAFRTPPQDLSFSQPVGVYSFLLLLEKITTNLAA